MNTSRPEYTSFLVRLWREPPGLAKSLTADREWLAQVEHIPSGEKVYMVSLEEMFAYIRGQLPNQNTDHRTPAACRGRGPDQRGPGDL